MGSDLDVWVWDRIAWGRLVSVDGNERWVLSYLINLTVVNVEAEISKSDLGWNIVLSTEYSKLIYSSL